MSAVSAPQRRKRETTETLERRKHKTSDKAAMSTTKKVTRSKSETVVQSNTMHTVTPDAKMARHTATAVNVPCTGARAASTVTPAAETSTTCSGADSREAFTSVTSEICTAVTSEACTYYAPSAVPKGKRE